MKYLILITAAFLLACQPKTNSEQKNDSLAVESIPATSTSSNNFSPPVQAAPIITTFQLPSPIDNYDIFIDAGTTLYSKASFESEAVKTITAFTPATELSETEKSEPEDGENCNRYLWYEVQLSDSTTGWVYGSSIEVRSTDDNGLSGRDVEINGKTYTLDYLADAGIGASDEDGLTGCQEYTIPYFYNAEEKTMHFIQASPWQFDSDKQLFITTYLNWFAFESSEGGGVTFLSLKVEETTITIRLSASYQEGGANGELNIDFTEGKFRYSSASVDDDENVSVYEEEAEDPRDDFADSLH